MRRFVQISFGWVILAAVIFVEVNATRAIKRFFRDIGAKITGAKGHDPVFSFNSKDLDSYRDFFKELHLSTISRDKQYTKSQLAEFAESINQVDSKGQSSLFETVNPGVQFVLGRKLATTGLSVIYEARAVLGPIEQNLEISGDGPWSFPFVVKYVLQSTGGARNKSRESDEIIKEYAISKFVSRKHTSLDMTKKPFLSIKISPYPIYLSPAMPAPTTLNAKCGLPEICEGERGTYKIRFLVMERAGQSLEMYSMLGKTNQLDPILLMKLMQEGTDLLEALHEKGIIHNDVHAGNIVWAEDPPNLVNPKFLLLDFGISRFYPDDTDSGYWTDMKNIFANAKRSLLSLHVLKGSRATRRDDMIRFIELIAMLWRGSNYPVMENVLELIDFKTKAKFFPSLPYEPSPLETGHYAEALGQPQRNSVVDSLNILAGRLTRTGLDEKPNYDLIRNVAKLAETCLSGIDEDYEETCNRLPLIASA